MLVAETKESLRQVLSQQNGPIVLVPTMGALHEGHLDLIRHARKVAGNEGIVAVSIFINPIQFDRRSDLVSYPQPLEDDLRKCRELGVDVVFTPQAETMYAPDRSVTVTESSLSADLCGATRPGHFDGVCTVVLKLFLLFQPSSAIFGEKDFQQLAIIRRMVRDLDVSIEIISHPTVRESDGLAMSSRNARLTPEHRQDAPRIRQALLAARELHSHGERSADPILAIARQGISASDFAKIDYLSLVDAETLKPVTEITRPAILASAVFYGDVRLIDHVTLTPSLP
jgi:pantoate--beta-alanine ligase